MNSYQPGNAIRIKEQLLDPSVSPPALCDPTSIRLTLTDPAGTIKLNAQVMTRLSIGRFVYLWQSDPADVLGVYVATVVVVRAGSTNINKYSAFLLTTEPDA